MMPLKVEPGNLYTNQDLLNLGLESGYLDGLRRDMGNWGIHAESGFLGAWVINYLSRNNGGLQGPAYVNAFLFAEYSGLECADVLERHYDRRPLTLVHGANCEEDVVIDSRDLHLFYHKPDDSLDDMTKAVIEYQDKNTRESLRAACQCSFGMMEKILRKLASRLPQHVEKDELLTAAYFGFLDAAKGFDRWSGIKFASYASSRILGAVLDDLREMDIVPRLDRQRGNTIRRVGEGFFADHGREPTDDELSRLTGIPVDEIIKLKMHTKQFNFISLDQSRRAKRDENEMLLSVESLESKTGSPVEIAIGNEASRIIDEEIVKAFGEIGEENRLKYSSIYELYYVDGLTMKDIGETMDLSESRVCQLMGRVDKILDKARKNIAKRFGEDTE